MYKYYDDVTDRQIRRKKEFTKILEDANIRYSSRNVEFTYRDDSAYKEIAIVIKDDTKGIDEEIEQGKKDLIKKKAIQLPKEFGLWIDGGAVLETDQRDLNDEEEIQQKKL